MKTISLFAIECSSEDEGWIYYFDGDGTKEQFEKDVRECVRKVLDEKYGFIKVDENTYIRKRALDSEDVKKFLNWVRNEFGYKGKIWIDVDNDLVLFTTGNLGTDYKIRKKIKSGSFQIYALDSPFLGKVKPHEVIGSGEFIRYMEERGWKYIKIESKGTVWFYEWGGFIQRNGKWYNHVWNVEYREI